MPPYIRISQRGSSSFLQFRQCAPAYEVPLGTSLPSVSRVELAFALQQPRQFLTGPQGNGYLLVFSFDHKSEPDTHYRLTIRGLMIDGSLLPVPPVDFLPYSESLPKF